MIKKIITQTDIPQVTEVHLKAFKGFFLSELGKDFLMLYYKCFLEEKNGFGVGIFDGDNQLIGFSVAATYSKGFNKKLFFNHITQFLKFGIIISVTNPAALVRLILNMTKNNNSSLDDGNYAELFSIAVDPEKQGSGAGKALLEETEIIAKEKGCKQITLTTDYFNNSAVINFYKKMGYNVFYDFYAYPKRKMYKMIKVLN